MVALIQFNATVGAIQENVYRLMHIIDEIRPQLCDRRVELIVTPELSVCGYPPEDWLLHDSFLHACYQGVQQLCTVIPDTMRLVVGFPEKTPQGVYNAAAVLTKKGIEQVYRKKVLPNSTVFDEQRYFRSGNKSCCIPLRTGCVGLLICEDVWCENQIRLLQQTSPIQAVVVINASPYFEKKVLMRRQSLCKQARNAQLPIFYCNLVGGQDELIFDGRSFIVSSGGDIVQQAKAYVEDVLFAHPTNLQSLHPMYDYTGAEDCYRALVCATHDFVKKNKIHRTVLGISGGIDSALTLSIAADALGADRCHAIMLKTLYTSKESVQDAQQLCQCLGVSYDEIDIWPLYQRTVQQLATLLGKEDDSVIFENIQSRLRTVILMAYSNRHQALLLSTSNKSELAMGYTTLYGDSSGGFAVIKDVIKTKVYALATWRNSVHPVIPHRILVKAPSAELRFDQTDQDTLPPYDVLDAFVDSCMDVSVDPEVRWDAQEQDMMQRLINSEFKRRQLPIGPKVTARSFGKDWRYPITSHFLKK